MQRHQPEGHAVWPLFQVGRQAGPARSSLPAETVQPHRTSRRGSPYKVLSTSKVKASDERSSCSSSADGSSLTPAARACSTARATAAAVAQVDKGASCSAKLEHHQDAADRQTQRRSWRRCKQSVQGWVLVTTTRHRHRGPTWLHSWSAI